MDRRRPARAADEEEIVDVFDRTMRFVECLLCEVDRPRDELLVLWSKTWRVSVQRRWSGPSLAS